MLTHWSLPPKSHTALHQLTLATHKQKNTGKTNLNIQNKQINLQHEVTI